MVVLIFRLFTLAPGSSAEVGAGVFAAEAGCNANGEGRAGLWIGSSAV